MIKVKEEEGMIDIKGPMEQINKFMAALGEKIVQLEKEDEDRLQ